MIRVYTSNAKQVEFGEYQQEIIRCGVLMAMTLKPKDTYSSSRCQARRFL